MNMAEIHPLGTDVPEILKQDHPACRIFLSRRERRRFFNESLFGEPAWDMLLLLCCASAKGTGINATVLTHASSAPPSVAQRWLSVLEDEGLVVRRHGPDNIFFHIVELTETGRSKMDEYLSQAASEAQKPKSA
jgi:DNA-binding MarR family transcriptional regulator